MDYRKAEIKDIELLCELRIEVLRAANGFDKNVNMDNVYIETKDYFNNYFNTKQHITYLAFDDEGITGCGSICFYKVMPTYNIQNGKKAYIMNMYTKEKYRRKGIGLKILGLLINEARNEGIKSIQLEATEMGKYLYKKYGFNELKNEMEYISE
jgi:ribosomal protein S18 acetylase RimI-like enzyme